eukprot:c17295_g1_i2 orf=220-1482(+)
MHGAVTQRSSSGFGTAAAISRSSDAAMHTFLWASKTHANNLGFQRRHMEKCVPCRQNMGNVRLFVVKADATTNGSGKSIAPLQPESPTGQFLVELLQSHPHLFSAAAEQQLDKLAEDRKAAEGQERSITGGNDLVLYKRIAELRAQERRTTVEEIMYALISHRFLEARISMVPRIPSLLGSQKVDNWPAQDKELQSVHSSEALELVWEHLAFILGVKGASESLDDSIVVQISKLHMGQVYATSALYGYFLRRVDEKFQMEKVLSPLLSDTEKLSETEKQEQGTKSTKSSQDDAFAAEMLATISAMLGIGGLKQDPSFVSNEQSTNLLRNYVLSFEADTLYRCATIRSMESACIIERHTEALFGKPDLLDNSVVVQKEDAMILRLAGLKRLVLEAVAFGSFLWDTETLVDSRYTIVAPEMH